MSDNRCLLTGNPVGTDTWPIDRPCSCVNCRKPTVSPAPAQEVKRYSPILRSITLGLVAMREQTDGAYVLFSDYQSLSAELERVKQERDELKRQRTTLIAAVDDWNARAEAAERSNTALRGALGFDQPYPVTDVLNILAVSAIHALDDHHCDHMHERTRVAAIRAREIAAALQVEGDTK